MMRVDAPVRHENGPRLRVLVLTNHFSSFAGSEIVALQTAQWFARQGDLVTLGANSVGAPIKHLATGVQLTTQIADIDLSAFDLVWCQHDLLSHLPLAAFERASRRPLPHVVMVSLSPYEPYEHIDGTLARALSADIYANSPETAAEIVKRSAGLITRGMVHVFHNAAPSEFWDAAPGRAPSAELKALTLISNHPPDEVISCLARLQQSGVSVRRIGLRHEVCLVRPEDIAQADAILTIGKSAPYAIAQGKPVFVYDHFGGDGWLTRANFSANLAHNFSGRPAHRRLTPEALAAEIVNGYPMALAEAAKLSEVADLSFLDLDTHMTALRERARLRSPFWPQVRLAFWLVQPHAKGHLATLQHKSTAMRRSYLLLHPGS